MKPRYKVKVVTVAIACEGPKDTIIASDDAARVARAFILTLGADQEHFVVLMLDARGALNAVTHVATGTISSTLVHPRDVFRAAILQGASAIIVAHNHPSGDPSPSEEDEHLTARLVECGDVFGIPVLDHLVIAASTFRSIPCAPPPMRRVGGFAS